MYKPDQTETLQSLTDRKKEVMNKIIHGEHLDSLSMSALQKQLTDLTKRIEEKKREEVLNG